MAKLTVTFSKAVQSASGSVGLPLLPLALGSACVTEQLEIGTDTDPPVSNAAADAGHYVVELTADADCWFAIGGDPVASVGGEGCRKMFAKENRCFSVLPGDKVSVTADA